MFYLLLNVESGLNEGIHFCWMFSEWLKIESFHSPWFQRWGLDHVGRSTQLPGCPLKAHLLSKMHKSKYPVAHTAVKISIMSHFRGDLPALWSQTPCSWLLRNQVRDTQYLHVTQKRGKPAVPVCSCR